MKEQLRHVKRVRKAVYQEEKEYAGKEATGTLGDPGGDSIHGGKLVAQQPKKEGVMSELPEDIQEYVKKVVSSKMQYQSSQSGGSEQEIQLEDPALTPVKDVIEKLFSGGQSNADGSDEEFGQSQQDEERGKENPESGSGEGSDEQRDKSCTEAERAFLDSFMALQEAGLLLGLVPSSRAISGTQIRNVKIVPVIDEVKLSDKAYITEMQVENPVYEMMSARIKVLFESIETMLKDKGL